MFVYALTIFTGAFLLFLVQPLIGKYILPWFGGTPAVWTTCLLFFQILLLGGYAYAHWLTRWLRPRAQAITHLVLVVAALAVLPITPSESWKPVGGADPTLRILGLLIASIGLPYLVLSSTGPLMQHWFSRSYPGASPFRLYALSNIGSLLALVSFPVLFETHFTRTAQVNFWGWGLFVYAVGCAFCVARFWKVPPLAASSKGETTVAAGTPPTLPRRLLWLLLPACASVLLLAMTNKICQEVAVIPFLWILPLSLYLLSFIICFDSPRWYVRPVFGIGLMLAMAAMCWGLYKGNNISVFLQIGIYAVGLFVCCMVCHGELYRLKPAPDQLTAFYLMIAAGGALGGAFVVSLAPIIFTDYYELQSGLVICAGLFMAAYLMPQTLQGKAKSRVLIQKQRRQKLYVAAGMAACLLAMIAAFWLQAHQFADAIVERSRNFYGVLTVFKHSNTNLNLNYIELSHGRTVHGLQFTDAKRQAWPTLYYSEKSGVGLCLQAMAFANRRIGLVGLGVGTLATYAKPGDFVRVFEINPEVMRLAQTRFTFLSNCHAQVDYVLGDARLSLVHEAPQRFDLLVLDAFNSDAIPVHLLTKEAFDIYAHQLNTNGIIAVHVSNKSLNLEPVVALLAQQLNYKLVTIDSVEPADKPWIVNSVWMLLSHDETVLNAENIRDASRPAMTGWVNIPLWTDDFASIFQILRCWEPQPQPSSEYSKSQIEQATALYQRREFGGAVNCLRNALEKEPNSLVLLNSLAFFLAACPDASVRNFPAAAEAAEKACELTRYRAPDLVGTLAAIYSEAGRYADAVKMGRKVCLLADEAENQSLLKQSEQMLELYRSGHPYHESLKSPPDQQQ